MENDPLRSVLREWAAPEAAPELDVRVLAAYRARRVEPASSGWRRVWNWRVSVPVPVLATLFLIVIALVFRFGAAPPAPPPEGRYVTRLDATGFQPLPNGAARVVTVQEISK